MKTADRVACHDIAIVTVANVTRPLKFILSLFYFSIVSLWALPLKGIN